MKKWLFILVVALACSKESSVVPVSKYHVTGRWDMIQNCTDPGGCVQYSVGFLSIELTSDSLFNTYVRDTLRLADHFRLRMKNDSIGLLTIYSLDNNGQTNTLEKDSLFIKYGVPKYNLTLKSLAAASSTLYKKR